MGTLGGEEAFFLGALDLAGAGECLEVGTTGLGEAGDESEELSVTVAGEDGALDLVGDGEEILACRIALAMRSERDRGFSVCLLTITSPTISTSSVTVCSRSLAGEGFWGLGIGSSRTGVGGVDSR